ncbi:hypothetical protein [Actimicrobium sp. CCI2.3]|uniref:hypothetical protein n=1 Tax=Actimicrobium sp. CCI2.3 TaxID=3048616 RepID=UPI002AB47A39|nr:hypothetical protein [Actimicrobium sp. CCI2.3]MDY7574217.1 hypothetical protein [Actimicrobium sp. CCI2.3]MEB0022783.1 hypothetical protein [Actimicrobium sp. CCI2.3]
MDARYFCALVVAMGFYSAPVAAQSATQSAADLSPGSVSATTQSPSPSSLDATFGQAVAEAKHNRELALKAEFEAKRRAELLSLMPGVGTAHNPFAGAMFSGAAPDSQDNTQPIVIGLTGAMGKYTAELWFEGKVYRVRSDQLPLRSRLWTVLQITEQGVVLNTRQKWTGVGRDGRYSLPAPAPGAPEQTLGAIPFGELATASAFQSNSLGQRLPSFGPSGAK